MKVDKDGNTVGSYPLVGSGISNYAGLAGLAWDGKTSVFVMDGTDGLVVKFDMTTGSWTTSSPMGAGSAIALDGTNIWVGAGTYIYVQPAASTTGAWSGSSGCNVFGGASVGQGLAWDGTAMWASMAASAKVGKYTYAAGSCTHVGDYTVGNSNAAIAYANGHIWTANGSTYNFTELNASDGSLVGAYAPAGWGYPGKLMYDGTNIWATARSGAYTLFQFTEATAALVATSTFGTAPAGLALGQGGFWIVEATSPGTIARMTSAGGLVNTYTLSAGTSSAPAWVISVPQHIPPLFWP